MPIELSVVIPVHNESATLPDLVTTIQGRLSERLGASWELVIVNDGSTDDTYQLLQILQPKVAQLRVLHLDRRSGQSVASWLGLQAASGQCVGMMDGDGQQTAIDLLRLWDALTDDVEVVQGFRTGRQIGWLKRGFSYLGNRFRRYITRSSLVDSGCSLRVFRRELLSDLIPFDGFHRFVPTLFEMAQRRIVVIPVVDLRRQFGKSHYRIIDRALVACLDCLMLCWLTRRRLPRSVLDHLSSCETELLLEQNARNEQDSSTTVADSAPRASDLLGTPHLHSTSSLHSQSP